MMWNDSLKIGVPLIDSEHKQLCDQIDKLFDACSKGKGRDELLNTLNFLENYTLKHFKDEEALQIKSLYPKYKEHKAIHDDFAKQVSDMKKKVIEEGATVSAVFKVNDMITKWLLNHIKMVDTELAKYIKQN